MGSLWGGMMWCSKREELDKLKLKLDEYETRTK